MEILNNEKSYLVKALLVLVIIVSFYFAVKIVSEIKSYNFIGGGVPAGNTISFNGKGEVTAAPDLAIVNLTIRADAKDVKEAQGKVTSTEKKVLDYLDSKNIAKKDIKTESYNSYPKYDYGTPCYSRGIEMPCPVSTPKVVGYEVSEYISVKVRDLTKAGEIVAGIGALGVSEISGPNFSIENEDGLKAQARKIAINEAQEKAESLAQDLGVRLVRIVNFSENGNYPMPMFATKAAYDTSVESAPSPQLPTGENKITSNVVITYEIR